MPLTLMDAQLFVKLNVYGSVLTIMACYITAQVMGHVDSWLPMISDCFVYPPESYVSRFGVVSFINYGVLMSNVLIVRCSDLSVSAQRVLYALSCVTGISFGLVGSISEGDNLTVHNMFALSGFMTYGIFLALIHFQAKRRVPLMICLYNALSVLQIWCAVSDSYVSAKPLAEWLLSALFAYNILNLSGRLKNKSIQLQSSYDSVLIQSMLIRDDSTMC
jgi:hypothetical protein